MTKFKDVTISAEDFEKLTNLLTLANVGKESCQDQKDVIWPISNETMDDAVEFGYDIVSAMVGS